MSRSAQYDVVIVGAGIAGCAAAALYGRRGARVARFLSPPALAQAARVNLRHRQNRQVQHGAELVA
jgi:glycine/D-amino acid oxidase-like deaminating enzyme